MSVLSDGFDADISGSFSDGAQTVGPNETAVRESNTVPITIRITRPTPKTGRRRTNNQCSSPPTLIHFGDHYPEGGWGWVVCAAAFIVHLLCQGLQLSYSTLSLELHQRSLKNQNEPSSTAWLGSLSQCVMYLLSPAIIAICRRKSPRFLAVVGGLITSLGCLFFSFSTQFEQHMISYGIVVALGSSLALNTANIMVGRYFNTRREMAEMFVVSGSGLGMCILPALAAEVFWVLDSWMRCLQTFAGAMFITFIAGCFYRSASLYHPRRKVILHIKEQKRQKQKDKTIKPPYLDFRALKMRSVQVIIGSASMSSFGIFIPFWFVVSLKIKEDGFSQDKLYIFPILMGIAYSVGTISVGLIVLQRSRSCILSRQCLCQIAGIGCAMLAILFPFVHDFVGNALCLSSYSLLAGGYFYTLKMLTYELTMSKVMERAWGYVLFSQSFAVLVGSPIAVYLNERLELSYAGSIFAGLTQLAGSLFLYILHWTKQHISNMRVLDEVHNEAHNIDVTVAVVPEFFGLNPNEFDQILVDDMGNVAPATPSTLSRLRHHESKPRHVQLKHKALNKLVQELNGHVGDLSANSPPDSASEAVPLQRTLTPSRLSPRPGDNQHFHYQIPPRSPHLATSHL
ncbi:monocarboxylate transporter 12-B-like [Tubulanus polymorphus]|uniref:monocarboxylate transporter 12-B-like n=1 Tax=Tubulanus polymorphus TaxID=672921 RepID=UPI003DA41B17